MFLKHCNKIVILVVALLFLSCSLSLGESQQTSGVTAQTIINNAKYEYLNDTGGDYWSDDSRLLTILNRGIIEVASLTKCLETVEKVVLLTGITEYAISSSYLNVEKAIYSGTTTQYNSSTLKGLQRIDLKNLANSENVGEPVRFYVWNDHVGIDPEPSSSVSGYAVYLYLIEKPTAITLTGTIPTPAIYDHALTLFVSYQALKKDRNINLSSVLQQEYIAEIARYREDFIDRLRNPTKEKL